MRHRCHMPKSTKEVTVVMPHMFGNNAMPPMPTKRRRQKAGKGKRQKAKCLFHDSIFFFSITIRARGAGVIGK